MLKEGDEVRVVYSAMLDKMKLLFLVSQRGVITKLQVHSKTPGAFVLIQIGRSAGEEWYVPLQSCQTRERIEKLRNISLLRTINLK